MALERWGDTNLALAATVPTIITTATAPATSVTSTPPATAVASTPPSTSAVVATAAAAAVVATTAAAPATPVVAAAPAAPVASCGCGPFTAALHGCSWQRPSDVIRMIWRCGRKWICHSQIRAGKPKAALGAISPNLKVTKQKWLGDGESSSTVRETLDA